jgi:hypothetical protein
MKALHREIINYPIYNKSDVVIHVLVEDESVWLTQSQMMELFDSSKQNVSLHVNNIFKEKELDKKSVVKYSLTTASDGKKYNTAFYNLDVIISVGYRIKSFHCLHEKAYFLMDKYLMHIILHQISYEGQKNLAYLLIIM